MISRMRRTILVGLVSLARFATTAAAQQRPEFAGEWTLADSADRRSVATQGAGSFRIGGLGSGWGSPITITQESNRLTVEYGFFSAYDLQPPIRFVYALDGVESSNSVMIGHASSVQRSRTAWRGDTLVITTLVPVTGTGERPPPFAEVRQALTLESPGRLVVETIRLGILGAATTSSRTVYTKR